MNVARIGNGAARRVFLDRHALAEPPAGAARGSDLLALIRRLGFVQVDSINTVERAHHMILWSRRQSYRPKALRLLHERDRVVFEHWTHDASIIPMEFLPHWRLRFARDAERLRGRYRKWQGAEFEAVLEDVIRHIAGHGPVASGDIITALGRVASLPHFPKARRGPAPCRDRRECATKTYRAIGRRERGRRP